MAVLRGGWNEAWFAGLEAFPEGRHDDDADSTSRAFNAHLEGLSSQGLLDLIRRQNIDIYDIPIARITAQFPQYTHHLKQVDVDAAGEFVYTASLLIHIKSKTLLPRDPSAT